MAKVTAGEPIPFAFKANAAATLRARLDAEGIEHLRIACEIWLTPPIADDTAAIERVQLCAAALIQAIDGLDPFTLQTVLWKGGRTPSAWHAALMSEATALAFAHEAAMALHDGSMALIEPRGKTTPRRGRPASGDWHLAGWVAAICLRNRITPSESEGTFSAVMTAAWHAVGNANLPTHAVRTMLAKVKAGKSTAFPVAHGVSYWLLPDDAGKPRVIFGHWNEINRQLFPADAQEKWVPKV